MSASESSSLASEIEQTAHDGANFRVDVKALPTSVALLDEEHAKLTKTQVSTAMSSELATMRSTLANWKERLDELEATAQYRQECQLISEVAFRVDRRLVQFVICNSSEREEELGIVYSLKMLLRQSSCWEDLQPAERARSLAINEYLVEKTFSKFNLLTPFKLLKGMRLDYTQAVPPKDPDYLNSLIQKHRAEDPQWLLDQFSVIVDLYCCSDEALSSLLQAYVKD
ncbi:hypothetical protein CAOG_03224 [Capsaspora owczarzaki ATCC 30864]|nr:hypothetical protein CAOG_03224 [Capsaspora owczarzaki ATCC 30864]|eukprot:XP_004364063.1 hypothetical protein CAOG_03224 [Capsaspora owczarzaki ATCC 30864]